MTNRKFYAGHCEKGYQVAISYWWTAYGFNTKEERDKFVQANQTKRKAITRKEMEKITGRLGEGEKYGILLNKSLIYCESFPGNIVEKFIPAKGGYIHAATNYFIDEQYVSIV